MAIMTTNLKAFLDTIAFSEIGAALLAKSDNGYNVVVGGALFSPYDDHPRVVVTLNGNLKSTAAGRYQILERYFDAYKTQLDLPDFSPESQDAIAVQMIKECHAFDDILAGNFDSAIEKCASRWASFPGADYDQHENKMEDLRQAFTDAGGLIMVGGTDA